MLSTISVTFVLDESSYPKAVKEAVRRARRIHGVPKSMVAEVVAERRDDDMFAVTVVIVL